MNLLSVQTRLWAVLLVAALSSGAANRADANELAQASSESRSLLAASGVRADQLDHYARILDRLAREFRDDHNPSGDAQQCTRAIHAFLHDRVLHGTYLASASDIGAALDGGPFNCAAATGLFLALAAECGLKADAVSVRGHVWCRVHDAGRSIEIETTCSNWFEIADRYAGVAIGDVSPAVAEHRRRAATGRVLSQSEFLAIFHYNRGVTFLRQQQFAAAAQANRRALALDPNCRPAQENLAAATSQL